MQGLKPMKAVACSSFQVIDTETIALPNDEYAIAKVHDAADLPVEVDLQAGELEVLQIATSRQYMTARDWQLIEEWIDRVAEGSVMDVQPVDFSR